MKKLIVLTLFAGYLFNCQMNAQSFTKKGYPEHFVAGAAIGGAVSYLAYKKTNNKFKSWVAGFAVSSSIGLLKEAADPILLKGVNSITDLQYTVLGGAIGASIVIPLNKKKKTVSPTGDALLY